MIVEAARGDEPALHAYLAKHFSTTMFMRGNLRDFGLGNKSDSYVMRYFMRGEAGEITGVGALANIGTIMLQAKDGAAEIVAHLAKILPEGFKPNAIMGAPDMVADLASGLGLGGLATKMNDTEPLFLLEKTALVAPDMEGFALRASTLDDLPLLATWNHAYDIEVLGGADTAKARDEARAEAERIIRRGHQRLLVKAGDPVSQTNFNAVMPDTVQLGGVFTPPCWRGHGFSRRAVASHMAEAFAKGAERAILFSASEAASKVYRAVGFRHVGAYQIILFE